MSLPWLEAGALAAGLAVALVLAARAAGQGAAVQTLALAVAMVLASMAAASRREPVAEQAIAWRPVRSDAGGYVGSQACQSCHPREHATWHASYHRTMTQLATPQNVAAPFDGVVLETPTNTYRLLERAGALWVEMRDLYHDGDAPAPLVRRRMTLTTGSHHEQDFWFETGPGRAIAHFPFVYRIPEKRWLPNGSTFVRPPLDPNVSPRPEAGGWNRNCIQCHSTHGVPGFGEDGEVATTVGELGIACEACHGPAARHVEANADPRRRLALRSSDEAIDDTIVNPARLDNQRSSQVCGQCHMVSTIFGPHTHPQWNEQGPAYRPGQDLAESRDILRPAKDRDTTLMASMLRSSPSFLDDRFWRDGMIRISGREYQGLLETGCFQRGQMSCLSCHRMHAASGDARPLAQWADDQLAPDALGDTACTGCHADLARDVPAHTHHVAASSGSRCYNCHMPHTTYGLLKAIRSHQVSSPSAAESSEVGRPNACNLCHLDKPLAWTAQQLNRWYGTEAPVLEADDHEVAASVRWTLEGDAGLRVLMAWHLGWEPALQASGAGGHNAWVTPYLARLLDDPYDAVRFVAEASLRRQPQFAALAYDCMAPAAERADVSRTTIQRSRSDVREVDAAKLLLEVSGAVELTAFDQRAARRDDRRVELRE